MDTCNESLLPVANPTRGLIPGSLGIHHRTCLPAGLNAAALRTIKRLIRLRSTEPYARCCGTCRRRAGTEMRCPIICTMSARLSYI
jgi:hypothetical protein